MRSREDLLIKIRVMGVLSTTNLSYTWNGLRVSVSPHFSCENEKNE